MRFNKLYNKILKSPYWSTNFPIRVNGEIVVDFEIVDKSGEEPYINLLTNKDGN